MPAVTFPGLYTPPAARLSTWLNFHSGSSSDVIGSELLPGDYALWTPTNAVEPRLVQIVKRIEENQETRFTLVEISSQGATGKKANVTAPRLLRLTSELLADLPKDPQGRFVLPEADLYQHRDFLSRDLKEGDWIAIPPSYYRSWMLGRIEKKRENNDCVNVFLGGEAYADWSHVENQHFFTKALQDEFQSWTTRLNVTPTYYQSLHRTLRLDSLAGIPISELEGRNWLETLVNILNALPSYNTASYKKESIVALSKAAYGPNTNIFISKREESELRSFSIW